MGLLTVQRIGTETGELGNKSINKEHRHCSIVEIGQNTSKNPTDLMRLGVTQTPVRNLQLMLV